MIQIESGFGPAQSKLEAISAGLSDLSSLYRAVAGTLEDETEANFASQGRPAWLPLAESTKAARLKRNGGSSMLRILQDHGILAKSVSSSYGPDFAQIGAGGAASAYAAAQQFGATIVRPPYSTKVRLRTDRQGGLLRQGDQGKSAKLAVFAKDRHKQARESWHLVPGFTVAVPARPYLPFSGPPESPKLQPEAESSVLSTIVRYLDGIAA